MVDAQLIERLAMITGQLVQFPTVAENTQDIEHCVDWVRTHVLTRASRLHVRPYLSHGRPSLLFSAGDIPPRVLLCGHLDVVEAQRQRDFAAYELDEVHLAGRGTADMKGPIAAMIDVMETEAQPGLGLLLTTDEESGGEDGVGAFLRTVEWRPDVVVLPDGGANMRLVVEQKGILRLKISADGEAAHGSRPWLGINAIDRLYQGYHALLRTYPIPTGEDDWRVSITLSQLNGGITLNSVPWYAEGILDIRYPGGDDPRGVKLLADITRRLQRRDIHTDLVFQALPFQMHPDALPIAQLQKVLRDQGHPALPLAREAGASDARYFSAEGVPVLMFQPECADWHGAHEHINLTSLAYFRRILGIFTRATLSHRGSGSRGSRVHARDMSSGNVPENRAAE